MVKRTIISIGMLLGAVYVYRELPEYRYMITLLVGVPLALLAIIVRRRHIFPIACCSICSLVGAAFTPIYCTHGNGLGFDTSSVIWNAILGGGVGMLLNAVQSQLTKADLDMPSRNVTPLPTKGEPCRATEDGIGRLQMENLTAVPADVGRYPNPYPRIPLTQS